MDEFVFITDSHIKSKNIESRTDDYPTVILDKFKFVVKYCKKNKIKNVIHGGDLFDSPNVGDYIAGKLASLMRKSGLQFYYIIGNHDITGKNTDTYVNGKLHMFESYPFFHFIGGKTFEFDNFSLYGFDYSKEMETEDTFDGKFEDNGKTKVIVIHHMVWGEKHDFIIGTERLIFSYRSIVTNADLVLCGHYHPGLKTKNYEILSRPVKMVNPGSLARTDTLVNREGVGPGLTHVKIDSNHKVRTKFVRIPHDKSVFVETESTKYDIEKMINNKFLTKLSKFKDMKIAGENIELLLKMVADGGQLPFSVTCDIVEDIMLKVKEIENGN